MPQVHRSAGPWWVSLAQHHSTGACLCISITLVTECKLLKSHTYIRINRPQDGGTRAYPPVEGVTGSLADSECSASCQGA